MPGSQTELIRIFLIDTDTLVRAGLRSLIEQQSGLCIIGEAGARQDALTLVTQTQPDVILLELNLDTNADGSIIPELLNAVPRARILLVTGVRDEQAHYRAVQDGAVGVVFKHQPPAMLFKAIAKIHAGEVWLDRSSIANVLNQMARGKQNGDPASQKIATLSQREREVIEMIGKGMRNRQIAVTLSISEVTVRHHLTSIFSKLGINDRLELIIFAYQHRLADLPR